jgi:hypothetical protein
VRFATIVMFGLFVLCIAVQYNDPDPLVWIALYFVPLALSVRALQGRADLWPNLLLAIGYLAAALLWAPALRSGYFDDEEAREAGGLVLSGAWMAVLAFQAWRRGRSGGA